MFWFWKPLTLETTEMIVMGVRHDKPVKVSLWAVMQRINRLLAAKGQQLRKARESYRSEMGMYYISDDDRNVIPQHHVDVTALAQQLGVLKSWERVEA
jgi:hypothetical protein